MDNHAVARVLGEIADLLELKDENPFKIRAYRNGADIVANHPHDLSKLDALALRGIPGIGRDLAARIREIADTGDADVHRQLVAEFSPTVLDLLHLQGVGHKTVAVLYRELGVRTLDDLDLAAADGRVRALRGMGEKKESLIRKAIADRKRNLGRHLLPHAHEAAAAIVGALHEQLPGASVTVVGSVRRGCESCGDLDLLASGPPGPLIEALIGHRLVERVLEGGETKSSVLLKGGFQADLSIVPEESRGAALQYFTGSKGHNIALRNRAIRMSLELNEYGVFRADDGHQVAGATEEEVYDALGLAWIPPELREDRGELGAAEARLLPRLINRADLRGDLHVHTTESDGKDDLAAMVDAAGQAGLEYLAITDHSKALMMANGLDEHRALAHAERVRALDGRGGVRLLAGIECDIKADGSLDLDDECLAALDIVVASVHSGFDQDREQMTDRLLRAIGNRHVDILGHPTGRRILRREPYALDIDRVLQAAERHGVALEINSQVDRLDLSDAHAKLARELGVGLVISSDAHSRDAFARLRWGVVVARRAWVEPGDVLNTRGFEAFRASLRRNRSL